MPSRFPTVAGAAAFLCTAGRKCLRVPAADNDDNPIKTDFFALGAQHFIDRNFTAMAEVPVWNRLFKTDAGPPPLPPASREAKRMPRSV